MSGPLATPLAWNLVAPGYSEYNQDDFTALASKALRLASVQAGERIVDVATGPGSLALLASPHVERVDALDFSDRMLEQLRQRMDATGVSNVFPLAGDGQKLPFESGQFDAAFSMFGLMFFPDRAAGFSELYRVLKPGGRAVVSAWRPMDSIEVLKALFSAIAEARGEQPAPPAVPPALSSPELMEEEMSAAGLAVQVFEVTNTMVAGSMREFLDGCLVSFAPICLMRNTLGEPAFAAIWEQVEQQMFHLLGPGPVTFPMRALLGLGRKA